MKRIWRERDKHGGMIEIQVLDRNNKVPEDLIWLHLKRKGEKEAGFVMKPDEARTISCGLFLAVDYIIEQYKLEKFKVKKQ
jgi:hypothetical protein